MFLLVSLFLFGLSEPGLPGVDAKPLGQYGSASECWALAIKLDNGQGPEKHTHKRHICVQVPIPVDKK